MVGLGPGRSIDIAAAQLVAREAGLLVGLPARGRPARHAPCDLDARFHVLGARDDATMDLLAGLLRRAAGLTLGDRSAMSVGSP